MLIWSDILADNGDFGEGLFYVVAVLILSIVGAVFEKFKGKASQDEDRKVERKPAPSRRRVPPRRPVDVERPAAPPVRPVVGREDRPVAHPPQRSRPRPPQRARPVRARKPAVPPRPVILVEPVEETTVERVELPGLKIEKDAQVAAVSEVKKTVADGAGFADIGSFRWLGRDEIRRAIVLNEILGPPLALRDYDRPWER